MTPPAIAVDCASALDQCCATKPCANGEACYAGPLVPVCSGMAQEPYNRCAMDQCSQDADCVASQICAPAGTLGMKIRTCVAARCKLDADCTAAPGGVCAPVAEPCCGTSAGLACVYPSGGCRSSADCASSEYCDVVGDTASCQPGAPVCPV
jgi:hypothetical protein